MGLMTQRLLRSPGLTIVAETDLITTEKKVVADPNGYYQVLGLARNIGWTQHDIKKAYRNLAKKYHPDGSTPDPSLFRQVQLAYAVLKEPETRAQYDELDSAGRWLDEEVMAAIIRKWAKAKEVDSGDIASVLKKAVLDKTVAPPAPVAPRHDGFAYYYYEGEQVPDRDIRERWAATVVQAMLATGRRGEVRLGFTQTDSHLVERRWGQVVMVSGNPNVETALDLVSKLVN